MRVREWVWQDHVREPRGDKTYIKRRDLTEVDHEFMRTNFHYLRNDPYDRTFLTRVYEAIRTIEVPGLDWWYHEQTLWFTHEHDKVLVYLMLQ